MFLFDTFARQTDSFGLCIHWPERSSPFHQISHISRGIGLFSSGCSKIGQGLRQQRCKGFSLISEWEVTFETKSRCFERESGPLFIKRMGVLPQDLVKCQSREIGCLNDRIALKFDRHLHSTAASAPIKFQIQKFKSEYHRFETSRDLAVRGSSAYRIEAFCARPLVLNEQRWA